MCRCGARQARPYGQEQRPPHPEPHCSGCQKQSGTRRDSIGTHLLIGHLGRGLVRLGTLALDGLFRFVGLAWTVRAFARTLRPTVCDVPARALEDDPHWLNDSPDGRTTLWTFFERLVSESLHGFEAVTTRIATIGICRHRSERSPRRSLLCITGRIVHVHRRRTRPQAPELRSEPVPFGTYDRRDGRRVRSMIDIQHAATLR
jgi:hypothetical protein